MQIRRLSVIIIFILLGRFCSANARNLANDSSHVEVRTPPAEQITKYAHSKDFQYSTLKDSESYLSKLRHWLMEELRSLSINKKTQKFLEIAFFIFIAVLIVLIINNFIKGGIFSAKKQQTVQFMTEQESSKSEKLDPKIRAAIKNNQYNLAVRLLYQKNLILLTQAGIIDWQKRKTNHDYLYEIKQPELQQAFRDATRYYEYAEYGNFVIKHQSFDKVHTLFKKMESLTGHYS